MREASLACPDLRWIRHFNYDGPDSLERAMERFSRRSTSTPPRTTSACWALRRIPACRRQRCISIGTFCSKLRCWPPHVLRAMPDDVFIGSPPLAFTFGLGGMLLSRCRLARLDGIARKCGPPQLLDTIKEFGATVLFRRANTGPWRHAVLSCAGHRCANASRPARCCQHRRGRCGRRRPESN